MHFSVNFSCPKMDTVTFMFPLGQSLHVCYVLHYLRNMYVLSSSNVSSPKTYSELDGNHFFEISSLIAVSYLV